MIGPDSGGSDSPKWFETAPKGEKKAFQKNKVS